uniref:Uncharacterized protein n=1 Tax=Arundo donax TaxID=35708 RepID=A0A0A9HHG8_ARUDO
MLLFRSLTLGARP